MNANAEDPLLAAAARICDGVPVDWRSVRELLANPALETVAHELESIEHFARASSEAALGLGPLQHCRGARTRGVWHGLSRGGFHPADRGGAQNHPAASRRAVRLRARDPGGATAGPGQPSAVVRVFAAERIGDEVGLSMELVEGKTLDAIVRDQGPFSASEASIIGMDLCRALAAVHGAGLLHGDIKAHNVMRANGGRTMLMDFGAGRELSIEPVAPGERFCRHSHLPRARGLRGREPHAGIRHLQPRRAALFPGDRVVPRRGATRTEIRRFHDQRGSRRPLRDVRPDLPDGFIRVVERALAEDPRQRFESAGSLEAALASPITPPSSGPGKSPTSARHGWSASPPRS